MKKKIYLVFVEHLQKDFTSSEDDCQRRETILCSAEQFVNLFQNIDESLYSIFAVDIIEIDSDNIFNYVKKNPNIEHGKKSRI